MPSTIEAAILCEEVKVDPAGGSKSLIGIFDGIDSFEFPFVRPMVLFVRGVGDPGGEIALGLTVYAPQWKGTYGVAMKDPVNEAGIFVSHLSLYDFKFTDPGLYRFALTIDEQIVAQATILVRKVEAPS